MSDGNALIKNTTHVLVVIALLYMVFRSLNISFQAYSGFDENNTPQCRDAPYCEYLEPINERANDGDRILMLGAFRYYLRPDLFACSTRHTEYDTLQALSYGNMDGFWAEVYRLGYKFLAYEKDYTIRHLQFGAIPGPKNTPDWVTLEPLYEGEAEEFMSYRIQYENPPVAREVICRLGSDSIWSITVR